MKLMDRWLESASIKDSDFAQLKELVLREQVYNSCHADLVTFLKERNAKTIADLKSLAETYAKAHPSKPLAREDNVYAGIRREEPTDRSTGPAQPANAARNEPTPRFRNNSQSQGQRRQPRSQSIPPRQAQQQQQNFNYQRWDNRGYRPQDRFSRKDRWSNRNGGRGYNHYQRKDDRRPFEGRFQPEQNYCNFAERMSSAPTLLTDKFSARPLPFFTAKVDGQACTALRDTGCNCLAASKRLLNGNAYTGKREPCTLFDGSTVYLETARCHIDSPFFTGNAFVFALPNSIADVIIGNISGVDDTSLRSYIENNKSDPEAGSRTSSNTANICTIATTRAEIRRSTSQTDSSSGNQSTNIDSPTLFSLGPFQDMDVQSFRTKQLNDPSLKALQDNAFKSHTHLLKNDLLYRKAKKTGYEDQLVVPTNFREEIMRLCHGTSLAGHLGITATKKRIFRRFTWPNITMDVKNYIGSCHQCQIHASRLPKLPIEEMEAISKPFERVANDIVGPLPMTRNKNQYILTLMDCGTRWPECSAF
ncbi:gypsy retrotransposon integrase-like protein 1 [Plakobranchus ocellatus]|uniref:Gypsy retrotransposon integrase-like protein 1 n=1 Tax=Plakobranchus ocellatus TaxID=259542 RepID=A0AAV3YJX3_9GAST|nr:gypsy retrotransposon integrase-like protein 1 [Plakobranchus ocellatus]